MFVTLVRVYYLLACPRLAEALNSSTVAPLTGLARSTPKPLTISNLLHSQHLSDDQHKDVVNKPLVKLQGQRSTDKNLPSKSRPCYYASRHAEPIEDLTEEEKGRKKVDGGGDIQVMRDSMAEDGYLDGEGQGREE